MKILCNNLPEQSVSVLGLVAFNLKFMKILLVSPNQSLQSKLHQTLLRHRFIVDLATDGEEAWGLLQTFVYDLVILEAIVPAETGWFTIVSSLTPGGQPSPDLATCGKV